MLVFISWSGETSHKVAIALNEWLPNVLQAAQPFLSSEMSKGTSWSAEIRGKLDQADAGIVCLTRDNLDSRWLNFEAGALAKQLQSNAQVCTFLIDIRPTDITGPLIDFQHTMNNKEDVLKLVRSINERLPSPLSEVKVASSHETWWPQLENLLAHALAPGEIEAEDDSRNDRDLLEELVEVARDIHRRILNLRPPPSIDDEPARYDFARDIFAEEGYEGSVRIRRSSADPFVLAITYARDEVPARSLKRRIEEQASQHGWMRVKWYRAASRAQPAPPDDE